MLDKVMNAFGMSQEQQEPMPETEVLFKRRADDKSDEEAHKKRAKGRRDAIDKAFSRELQLELEEASLNWPQSSKGFPLSGYRSKLINVMGMDHKDPEAHDLCDLWHDTVGNYFLGRRSYVGDDDVIYGPSPVPGISDPFPYSQADYIRGRDEWRIRDENHPLYETFHGRRCLRVG